jgi:hypothetical protein
MKHLIQARACRDFAAAFPELAVDLGRIETHFLRSAVEKQALFSHLRSLQIRRIEAGVLVDLLADLNRALRCRANGLQPDTTALQKRASKIADEIEALRQSSRNSEDQYGADKDRLRQAAALLAPRPRDEVASMPEWFSLLGDRNARQWSTKRLDRSLKALKRNPRLSSYRLEELIIGEFGSKMLGRDGGLGDFMFESCGCYDSPWFWNADPGTSEQYRKLISAAIGKAGSQGNDILHILWRHPRVWRDLSSSNPAAQAMAEAIVAICDVITFFAEEHVAFPEEAMPVISMNTAIAKLEEATKTLRDETDRTFPERVKFSGNPDLGIGAAPLFAKLPKMLDAPGHNIFVREFLDIFYSMRTRPVFRPYYVEKVFEWYTNGPRTKAQFALR